MSGTQPTIFKGEQKSSDYTYAVPVDTSGLDKDTTALDSDVKSKIEAKFSKKNEEEARAFIESKTGSSLGENFGDALKDGLVLCNLANAIRPGSVSGAKSSTTAFGQMENINKFLKALINFGFKSQDTFQTVDLYEQKNMVAVIDTILMLKRKTGGS